MEQGRGGNLRRLHLLHPPLELHLDALPHRPPLVGDGAGARAAHRLHLSSRLGRRCVMCEAALTARSRTEGRRQSRPLAAVAAATGQQARERTLLGTGHKPSSSSSSSCDAAACCCGGGGQQRDIRQRREGERLVVEGGHDGDSPSSATRATNICQIQVRIERLLALPTTRSRSSRRREARRRHLHLELHKLKWKPHLCSRCTCSGALWPLAWSCIVSSACRRHAVDVLIKIKLEVVKLAFPLDIQPPEAAPFQLEPGAAFG